jgi:hypothetical protein
MALGEITTTELYNFLLKEVNEINEKILFNQQDANPRSSIFHAITLRKDGTLSFFDSSIIASQMSIDFNELIIYHDLIGRNPLTTKQDIEAIIEDAFNDRFITNVMLEFVRK